MKTLWQEERRRELRDRISRLTPETKGLWGRMNASQMVAHLVASVRMATGDLPTQSKRTPLRHPPLKQLIIYVLPFPKGTPTARELQPVPRPWHVEVDELRALLDRFAMRDRNGSWPVHPVFGPLSARGWGVLAYRHLDHHLRQFGV
jgi:hypothetical protein